MTDALPLRQGRVPSCIRRVLSPLSFRFIIFVRFATGGPRSRRSHNEAVFRRPFPFPLANNFSDILDPCLYSDRFDFLPLV